MVHPRTPTWPHSSAALRCSIKTLDFQMAQTDQISTMDSHTEVCDCLPRTTSLQGSLTSTNSKENVCRNLFENLVTSYVRQHLHSLSAKAHPLFHLSEPDLRLDGSCMSHGPAGPLLEESICELCVGQLSAPKRIMVALLAQTTP